MSVLVKDNKMIRALVSDSGGQHDPGTVWTLPVLQQEMQLIDGVYYAISADSVFQSNYPIYAFDGSGEKYWHSIGAKEQGTHWLMLQTSKAVKVESMQILTRNEYGENLLVNPQNLTLLGSNDGESWESIYSTSNSENLSAHLYEYAVESSKFYLYHKLRIDSVFGQVLGQYYAAIGELTLIGKIKN